MTVEHRFIHTRIRTLVAFERFRAVVIAQVIFEMVFVLGDEGAFRTGQQLLRFDVAATVVPKFELRDRHEVALFTLESFHFPLRINSRKSDLLVRFFRFLFRAFTLIRRRSVFILNRQLIEHRFHKVRHLDFRCVMSGQVLGERYSVKKKKERGFFFALRSFVFVSRMREIRDR